MSEGAVEMAEVPELADTSPDDEGPAAHPVPLPGDPRLRTANPLSIHVMGRPLVRLGDVEVRFPTRHAQLAVYLLAIAGSDGLPTDQLIDTLWHGAVPRQAGQSMRTMLWQVRRSLAHEAWRVHRRRGGLLLELDGAILDFEPGAVLEREMILHGWVFRVPEALETRLIDAA
jgi:hypothetical protein